MYGKTRSDLNVDYEYSVIVQQPTINSGDCNTTIVPLIYNLPAVFVGISSDVRILILQHITARYIFRSRLLLVKVDSATTQ